MRHKLKLCFLYVCRSLFLFKLAKYITRSKVRILCYHGFSNGDEKDWAGSLMIHSTTLKKRLNYIKENGYKVISLDKAVSDMTNGAVSDNSLVITLDDGFQSTFTIAHPIFCEYSYPYTVYLTTYYCNKDIPIINLLIRYALWKTDKRSVSLLPLGIDKMLYLNDNESVFDGYVALFNKIDGCKSFNEKHGLVEKLLEILGLKDDDILSRDALKILTIDQVRHMAEVDVDFQLHTHRHQFPENEDMVRAEIEDNRRFISQITDSNCAHFCYPSGVYHVSMLNCLRENGIKSATTCEPGMSDGQSNMLLLRRYLDSEALSQIEYESLVSGFVYLLKKCISLGSDDRLH